MELSRQTVPRELASGPNHEDEMQLPNSPLRIFTPKIFPGKTFEREKSQRIKEVLLKV